MEANDTFNGQKPAWEQVADVSDQKNNFYPTMLLQLLQ